LGEIGYTGKHYARSDFIMPKFRLILLALTLSGLLVLTAGLVLTAPTTAQDVPIDPSPYPITPGVPLIPITPTGAAAVCYPPLSIKIGDLIYIEPGVNIRNLPDMSGAVAWNTIYDNMNEDGAVFVDEDIVNVPATVVEGPVCADGYNWWRVTGTKNGGWVAEGRPDDERGYQIIVVNAPAPCAPVYNLAIGKPVTLEYNVRIREAPSLAGLTRTIVPFHTPIEIVAGPECVEGLLWWVVRAPVNGLLHQGWMAEADDGREFLIPQDLPSTEAGTLCAYPLPLAQGARGFVYYRDDNPKSLRAAPDVDSTLLFTLVRGIPFIIEGGPICADNMNWWKVRVLSTFEVAGWLSEGSPAAGYWISTIDPDEFAR
jgi:hypothetical protein